uniref:Uncharacterized protein n=1 Tax=Salix viminalis TaxID=40686 RepID=A0A6N2K8I6_SALVM
MHIVEESIVLPVSVIYQKIGDCHRSIAGFIALGKKKPFSVCDLFFHSKISNRCISLLSTGLLILLKFMELMQMNPHGSSRGLPNKEAAWLGDDSDRPKMND